MKLISEIYYEHFDANDLAPDFTVSDIDGNEIHLYGYKGKKVLLCFFRYATCPFCTVRFVRLSQEVERYSQQSVQVIGVFESSAEYIKKYLGSRGLTFPIIPDPSGELYGIYGVKKSVSGLMFGMFRLPTLLRALFDSKYRMEKADGSITRIYFGSDIGDHIPFKRIDKFAE